MKKILLLCFFTTYSFSQFNFQHMFSGHGAQRIMLENSGEKYFISNRFSGQIILYNADFSVWKIINHTVPTSTYDFYVSHISENKLNADNSIEIVCTYSSSGIYQSKIIKDDGTVLLSVDNCNSIVIDERMGLLTKIIAKSNNESKIYSTSNFSLEHSYVGSEARRINLDYSGYKYYSFDAVTGVVTISNIDHSLYKTVTLTKPANYIFSDISFISENQFSNNNLIEIGYSYFIQGSNTDSQSKIVNENGTSILVINNASNIEISNIDGLPKKLIAYLSTSETQVYSYPNLILEHTYAGSMVRVNLEISGEKYHTLPANIDFNNPPVVPQTIIYNSDHTIWKTIDTPVPQEYWSVIDVYVSETKFDSDNQIELAYTVSSNTLNGGYYNSYIINEDGSMLQEFPDASGLYLSEFPNVPKKILAFIHQNQGLLFIQKFTYVYNFDQNFSTNNYNFPQVTFFPNPTSDFLEFKSENNIIVKAIVYDVQGKILKEFENKNITLIDVKDLKSGFYVIELTNTENQSINYKFIKN